MKLAWTPRLRSPTRYMAPGTEDFEAEFKIYFIFWLMINKCQPNLYLIRRHLLICLGLEVACSSPFGGLARSHARAARERSRECEGWGKKGRAMADIRPGESFPPPAPLESRLVAAPFAPLKRGSAEFEPRGNWVRFSERTLPANYTTVFLMYFEVKYRVVDGFSSRRNQQKK